MAEQEQSAGEERAKDVDRRKICPIMTAGANGMVRCIGVECGIWNRDAMACGLLEGRVTIHNHTFNTNIKGGR